VSTKHSDNPDRCKAVIARLVDRWYDHIQSLPTATQVSVLSYTVNGRVTTALVDVVFNDRTTRQDTFIIKTEHIDSCSVVKSQINNEYKVSIEGIEVYVKYSADCYIRYKEVLSIIDNPIRRNTVPSLPTLARLIYRRFNEVIKSGITRK
jgi:hypothetical protein